MVADFSEVERIVRGFVDQNLDHKLLLRRDDPLVEPLRRLDEPLFLMDQDPTAESIARLICDRARAAGLDVSEVRLWRPRRPLPPTSTGAEPDGRPQRRRRAFSRAASPASTSASTWSGSTPCSTCWCA